MDIGIYTRLSQDRDGRSTSTGRQEDDCRSYAQARGWQVIETYTDVDISAYNGATRPGLEKLLTDLEARVLDGAVIWKIDRLVRSPREFERVVEILERSGATLAAVNDLLDTSSPQGLLQARLLVNFARMESDNISVRTRSAKAEYARSGKPNLGGPKPFGWQDNRIDTDPKQAAVIHEIVARLFTGEAMRSIVRDVNDREGYRMSPRTWRRILRSPRIAGLREHRGEVVGEGTWEPILDRDTWERVKAIVPERGTAGRPPKYLLVGGMARCGAPGTATLGDVEGICGQQLYSRPERGGLSRYVCAGPPEHQGCGRISIRAVALEQHVIKMVIIALAGPGLDRALAKFSGEGDDADQLQHLERQLEQLAVDHYSEGRLSRAEFFAARDALEKKARRVRARLQHRVTRSVLETLPRGREELEAAWDGWTLEQQRLVLDAVLECIIIRPAQIRGRRFDRDRVEPVWKV